MTSHYQWDINAQTKHAPTSAERRFAPVRALYATPPGFAFVFLGGSRGLGLRVFAFYALTGRPLRGSTAGLLYTAPPGLKFRLPSSLLRSYAVAGAYARKIFPPSPLQLPICRAAYSYINHNEKT